MLFSLLCPSTLSNTIDSLSRLNFVLSVFFFYFLVDPGMDYKVHPS